MLSVISDDADAAMVLVRIKIVARLLGVSTVRVYRTAAVWMGMRCAKTIFAFAPMIIISKMDSVVGEAVTYVTLYEKMNCKTFIVFSQLQRNLLARAVVREMNVWIQHPNVGRAFVDVGMDSTITPALVVSK